jgi:LPXTG-motif cell wall-anchored protein
MKSYSILAKNQAYFWILAAGMLLFTVTIAFRAYAEDENLVTEVAPISPITEVSIPSVIAEEVVVHEAILSTETPVEIPSIIATVLSMSAAIGDILTAPMQKTINPSNEKAFDNQTIVDGVIYVSNLEDSDSPFLDIFHDSYGVSCQMDAAIVISNTTNTVAGGGTAVATTQHPTWTAQVPNATWIWDSLFVQNPSIAETKTFEKNFTLPVDETYFKAQLMIAADNSYQVWVNDIAVGADASEDNYTLGTQDKYDIDPSILHAGTNTIKIEVTNMAGSDDPLLNTAGVLYHLRIGIANCDTVVDTGDEDLPPAFCGDGTVNQSWESCDTGGATESCTAQCQNTNVCTDKAFAKVSVTTLENTSTGNMTSDVYVGGNTLANKIPTDTWFYIGNSVASVIDPDIASYQDVPGFAIERNDGYVRLNQYANHPDDGHEHTIGALTFMNAALTGVTNDVDFNKMELKDTQKDSFSMADDAVNFEMHTTPKADGFYAYYTKPDSCDDTGGGGGGGGTQTGTITVTKVVVNNNGGTGIVSDFPLFVGATGVVSGASASVNVGTYAVTETGASGYEASYSGDCDSTGSITIGANENKTCTITNDDIPTSTGGGNGDTTPGDTNTTPGSGGLPGGTYYGTVTGGSRPTSGGGGVVLGAKIENGSNTGGGGGSAGGEVLGAAAETLPQTGAATSGIAILGVMMMIITWGLQKRYI